MHNEEYRKAKPRLFVNAICRCFGKLEQHDQHAAESSDELPYGFGAEPLANCRGLNMTRWDCVWILAYHDFGT